MLSLVRAVFISSEEKKCDLVKKTGKYFINQRGGFVDELSNH